MQTTKKVWTLAEVQGWFAGRVPEDWFTEAPVVTADREEILVIGSLAPPELPADAPPDGVEMAHIGRIKHHREATRGQRMRIADEAEILWGRKVSWGARSGEVQEVFTTQSVPVMSRLRMSERAVLDTLIDAGVARSRSEALAWCVRLVGQHQSDWIEQLREAIQTVERVRADGPDVGAAAESPDDADEPATSKPRKKKA